MVYTFVQQENPVFCFISRERISSICLIPETKFSKESQHKSDLNPKLVIVTKTTKFYLQKASVFLWVIEKILSSPFSKGIFIFCRQSINFLVLSIQFQLDVNISLSRNVKFNIVVFYIFVRNSYCYYHNNSEGINSFVLGNFYLKRF